MDEYEEKGETLVTSYLIPKKYFNYVLQRARNIILQNV